MSPRLVIVHERFTEIGGSEQVVRQLSTIAGDTRIFAPIVDDAVLGPELAALHVTSSGLQRWYRSPGGYAHLLPLLPAAMARADLSDADAVITSHHAFANRVKAPPGVPVISYTHSPARWMWDGAKRQGEPGGRLGSAALRAFAATARRADRAAANRIDLIVANSETVAGRIRRWWGRHAPVVHPPVDIDYFTPDHGRRDDFLLVAGRLVPYKRVDVAVEAATRLGRRLVVAGDGRARPELEAAAGSHVDFLGPVSDDDLRDLYRRCSALLFPGEEDFGIIPVEAQACGAPVIATRAGGATETVVDGVTGVLVTDPARHPRPDRNGVDGRPDLAAAFCAAIEAFEPAAIDPVACRTNAERFSRDRFRRRMSGLLAERVPGWPALDLSTGARADGRSDAVAVPAP